MSECQRVGVCTCDVRCIAIIALTKELQYPHLFTHSYQNLGTRRFYTTLYRIYNSSSSMAASSKPHKISVPNTGEDKTYFHVSTSKQSCVTAQLLLHCVRTRLNSLEVFHHSQCSSLAQ